MLKPIDKFFIVLITIILILFMYDIATQKTYADQEWNQGTYAKFSNLVSIGFDQVVATALINECKNTAKDPVNCIKIGASILGAESSMGNKCHKNNCVGMYDGRKGYKSKQEGLHDWVTRYNKWWYKQRTPHSFYRKDGVPPVTRYCMGPKNDGVCVN